MTPDFASDAQKGCYNPFADSQLDTRNWVLAHFLVSFHSPLASLDLLMEVVPPFQPLGASQIVFSGRRSPASARAVFNGT
jgi:hypothetical protein